MSSQIQYTPETLGAMRDHFGLLTKDRSGVRPDALKRFFGTSFGVKEIAKHLNVSRTALYTKRLKISHEFMKKKMIPIIQAADLAYELLKDDEATRRWILSPNSYFFGKSPLEVCLLGDGETLIEFLVRKLGRHNEEAKRA